RDQAGDIIRNLIGSPGQWSPARWRDRDFWLPGASVPVQAKAGLPADDLVVSNVASGLYENFLTIPTVGGPIADQRGWTAVDVTVNRRSFRFINTHLDSTSP